jgi:hypothetical protein
MSKPEHVRQWQNDRYNEALEKVIRAPDKSFDTDKLREALIVVLRPYRDYEKMLRREAKKIIGAQQRPEQTDPDGQLELPGIARYRYEPDRLIISSDGRRGIENSRSSFDYKQAQLDREDENIKRAQIQRNRTSKEVEIFKIWRDNELRKGTDPTTLTWENCIKAKKLKR